MTISAVIHPRILVSQLSKVTLLAALGNAAVNGCDSSHFGCKFNNITEQDGKSMALTLSRLRSFFVLAETKSFERTAIAVERSQPAITEQIRTLEETLGVALFHRSAGSLTSGQAFSMRFSKSIKDT